jgi:hypothetical protein
MSHDVPMIRVGVLGAELTESQTALRVFLAAGGLVLLGLVLLLLTIWWWRGTKPEPPALGPLEVMSDRKWATAADGERRRLLEEHRPEGATAAAAARVPEPVDLSALARDVPSSFDDLRDPVEVAVAAPADPEAAELASNQPVDPAEALDRPSGSPAVSGPVADPDASQLGDLPVDASVESDVVPHQVSETGSEAAADATVVAARPDASDLAGPADATTAMTRDEAAGEDALPDATTAMPAPGQPFAPQPGA